MCIALRHKSDVVFVQISDCRYALAVICSAYALGMGWGALIGANITDFVLILNTDAAVEAFSGKGQVSYRPSMMLMYCICIRIQYIYIYIYIYMHVTAFWMGVS